MGLEKKTNFSRVYFPGKITFLNLYGATFGKRSLHVQEPQHTHIYHARMSILTLSEIKTLRYSVLKGFNHDVSVVK